MEPLVVPGSLDSLELIGGYVVEAASLAGIGKRESYRLRLAVDEVATNIISHGYAESGRDGDVVVTCGLTDEALSITLEDTAVPFDPRGAGRPSQIDQSLDERPIGGLGVYLALGGVDRFQYEFVNGRNRNIFVVRRPSS